MHPGGVPRYEQHQSHYRQPHHHNYEGGVPQQGPPQNIGQARMTDATSVVGPQHIPQEQQPQQIIHNQQVEQQQEARVGVTCQHHQAYPQVSTQGHHADNTGRKCTYSNQVDEASKVLMPSSEIQQQKKTKTTAECLLYFTKMDSHPTPKVAGNDRPLCVAAATAARCRLECVRNIFTDYFTSKRFDEAWNRVNMHFPGQKIVAFMKTLTKLVVQMKEEMPCEYAGRLTRLLIGNRDISKNMVINVISCVVEQLVDILEDFPTASDNLAQFLVEIFSEETNLDWLAQIGAKLIKCEEENEEKDESWRDLATKTMALFNMKNGEEFAPKALKKPEDN